MSKIFFKEVKVIVLGTALAFGISAMYTIAAPANPPNNNAPRPISVADVAATNTKSGDLSVDGLSVANIKHPNTTDSYGEVKVSVKASYLNNTKPSGTAKICANDLGEIALCP